jgi:hypothetical protein
LRVLVVAIPRSAGKNLEIGLDNGVWGIPPGPPNLRNERLDDYRQIERGDLLLLASGYTGGSPRRPFEGFVADAATQQYYAFEEVYRCVVNEPYYESDEPFWPEEFAGTAIYPHRFGIDPTFLGTVSLAPGVALSAEVLEALRVSLIWSSLGYLVDSAGSPALQGSGVDSPPVPPQGGQGLVPDAARRRAVESRAMELAAAWYAKDGWTVKDVSRVNPETEGTPYDLACTKGAQTRHVEVKGSTSDASTVFISRNERLHAEKHDDDTESYLFIVAGIGLKIREVSVVATRGDIRYHGTFDTDPSRFSPTQYRYDVP